MQPFFLGSICVGLVAGTLAAQRIVIYDPVGTGGAGMIEVTAPSALVPGGSPPLLVYPEVPVLPPPPAFMPMPGDSTFENAVGYHLYTNGLIVAAMPTPMFVPLGPMPAPIAIPGPVLNAIGGPVTGMAIAPGGPFVASVLYLVSAPGIVVGVTPAAGMPIVVAPFPIQFPMLAPISGLEWDAMTNRLLACDTGGNVYPFFPGGFPAGPMIAGPVGLPGTADDVVIDKTGSFNAWGTRSIYVLVGPVFADVTAPGAAKPVYPTGGSPMATGIAYLPYPSAMPVAGVCPCPNFLLAQTVTGPMTARNLGFGITMSGLPAGQLAVFALDFVYNPLFPFINGIGCGLGLILGSPTMSVNFVVANAAGMATYPLPLAVPPGTGPVFYQGATFCRADPVLGIVITPMLEISASGW